MYCVGKVRHGKVLKPFVTMKNSKLFDPGHFLITMRILAVMFDYLCMLMSHKLYMRQM